MISSNGIAGGGQAVSPGSRATTTVKSRSHAPDKPYRISHWRGESGEMSSIEEAAAQLLSADKDFNVALLDDIVAAAYSPTDPNRARANTTLIALQESPYAWTKADGILEHAKNPQSLFFGLQLLDDAIRTRWKVIPQDQRLGIKNYVVGKIIQISSDGNRAANEKIFLSKLNLTLVQILKHEWPTNWPSFIPDLVGSSKTSELLCENNMKILKLLSEEIFDFSRDQMVTDKVKSLKESLNNEFSAIYQLCEFVLEHSQRPALLRVTLQTLQRFLTWIPLGYIFQTNLVSTLISKFFADSTTRNDALDCLVEIGSLSDLPPEYDPLFRKLFVQFLQQLSFIIRPTSNIVQAFADGSEDDEIFVQRLALFFSGFIRSHFKTLETTETSEELKVGLQYLVRVSEVDDTEIFRISLDAWYMLSLELYNRKCKPQFGETQPNEVVYSHILTQVRTVMIEKMAKPEEVLIVEDENGDIVRETTRDTDTIAQYKLMRETLVYLTHLDSTDTENIMLTKLSAQVSGAEWSWNNLNTLCWAIGSVSGAMSEDEEKRFLVTVIKDLLGLCEQKRGKDNKAVVASNIMYVVGQYPRFLKAHWKFLKTVVNKLFEFMHEVHPGVQDMACDTFLKIAIKCRRKFLTLQTDESVPFIVELLSSLPTITCDLEPHQVETFYEAVACMLKDNGPAITVDRPELLHKMMKTTTDSWKNLMARAGANISALVEPDSVKLVTRIMKINVKVCRNVGSLYAVHLQTFFMDVLNVHKVFSEEIKKCQALPNNAGLTLFRLLRGAKKEIVRLFIVFTENSAAPESEPKAVAEGFLPPVMDTLLSDYHNSAPGVRDAEVLALFAVLVNKLQSHILPSIPRVIEAVLESSLQMISHNFEDYPELRLQFFRFIQAVNQNCFAGLFHVPPESQRMIVDSIVWGCKHTERNISDKGLEILHEFLKNVAKSPEIAQGFYKTYLVSLVQDIFAIMTDRLHKSGFKMQATLLHYIIHLVLHNHVTEPLYDASQGNNFSSNTAFLHSHLANLLASSFPNLGSKGVTDFVDSLFDVKMDLASFKICLRDFLVKLKEFSGEEGDDGDADLADL